VVPRTLESDAPLLQETGRKGKSKTKVTKTIIPATVLKIHKLISLSSTHYLSAAYLNMYTHKHFYIYHEVNAKMDRILNHRHRRKTGILIQTV
jgi:hypothetical protein